jgi:hypothetical protein
MILLLVGVAIVAAFTGRGDPLAVVIWLILAWLLALVAAMIAYSARNPTRGDRSSLAKQDGMSSASIGRPRIAG